MAAVGDAEDHVKIILKGENGRVVDLEISGGTAIVEPEHTVYGTRGALTCNGGTIHLRYIDPKQKLSRAKANPGTPGMEACFHKVGRQEELHWIEETIEVSPNPPSNESDIWNHLHATLRRRKPFPITLDQALEVMKVVSAVKKANPADGLKCK